MNRADKCALSGKPCWEVVIQHPLDGSPLAGEPRELGSPMACARRIVLLMLDGSTGSVTVHADHVGELFERLPQMWRNCCKRVQFEREHAAGLGVRVRDAAHAQQMRAIELGMIQNIPIGILAVQRWSDL